ncbi:MAG: hypothetical protein COZ18_04910 [Flexibacter sp. CG_4_10_14_3_um_filter_32_15]|nr:MAG: hypothetical protein COZ18_04910 [Flexibacter sp. CG_4_10_14_3_um_filter_32_15]
MKYYYNTPACQVYYDEEKGYIHTNWEGFCPSKVFKEASNSIITAIEETGTGKVLFDAARTKSASPNDQKWIFEDWIPRAVVAGYNRYAYILPNDVFGKFSSQKVISEISGNTPDLAGATSNDMETAMEWLLKENETIA